jgi:hypothetical protein
VILIPFKIAIVGRLSDEFARGFRRISIERLAHKLAATVYLWRADGTGIRVQSEMHDIAGWIEVGSLVISHVDGPVNRTTESGACETETFEISLPSEFESGLSASKLVLSTQGKTVESGLFIESTSGSEIVLVAGAAPYTVAVKAPSVVEPFEPEYDLTEYSREPITET